jgi:hypothetical protein
VSRLPLRVSPGRTFADFTSPVFRDMLETCEGVSTPILLTDEFIEKSDNLRLLLDLACNKPFLEFDKATKTDIVNLVKLAEKYDCVTPLTTLSLLIKQPATTGTNVWDRFVLACVIDSPEAAHRFFLGAVTYTWIGTTQTKPISVNEAIIGEKVPDVTTMSSTTIDLFPRPYFLCLLRATRLRLTQPPGSWQEVADEFLVQLRILSD